MGGRQNGMSDFRMHLPQPGMLINMITLGYLDYGPSTVENSPAAPVNFRLEQNYPNPFNPITSIQYQVPFKSSASLKIYNVRGELIRTLVETDQDAGVYMIIWDGLDNRGHETSSGMYVYQLISENFQQSHKMLKLK